MNLAASDNHFRVFSFLFFVHQQQYEADILWTHSLLQACGAGPSVLPGKPAIKWWQRAADGTEAESGAPFIRTGRSFRRARQDSQRHWGDGRDSQPVQHWALCCPMRRRRDGASQEKTLNTQLSLYCLIWNCELVCEISSEVFSMCDSKWSLPENANVQ